MSSSDVARRRRLRRFPRATSIVIVLASVAALVLALRDPVLEGTDRSVDWLLIVESTINDLVFASIAVFFLWAMPERLERRTLLDLLHRLRSLAHVVDMHQDGKVFLLLPARGHGARAEGRQLRPRSAEPRT